MEVRYELSANRRRSVDEAAAREALKHIERTEALAAHARILIDDLTAQCLAAWIRFRV